MVGGWSVPKPSDSQSSEALSAVNSLVRSRLLLNESVELVVDQYCTQVVAGLNLLLYVHDVTRPEVKYKVNVFRSLAGEYQLVQASADE
jgi:hypothetical protein